MLVFLVASIWFFKLEIEVSSMISLILCLIPAGERIRVAATRGGYFRCSRLRTHDSSLHILEHALDASDIPLERLIPPHFFS